MNPTKDPVYDKDDQKPVTRPDLRQMEEGGQPGSGTATNFSFNPHGDGNSQASTGSDAGSGSGDNFRFSQDGNDKDGSTGTTGVASSLLSKELASTAGVAGAATTLAGSAKNLFLGSKRRKQASLGGGIGGLVIVGFVLILGAASGPSELMHLSQMLQRAYGNSQNASSNRLDKLYRYASAEDIGETRLGFIGKKFIRPQIAGLNDLGISFDLNKVAGINGTTIDTDKLAAKYPELKSIPEAERGVWLADNVFSNVANAGGEFQHKGGSIYEIDGANSNLSSLEFDKITAKDSLGILTDGHIVSAMGLRVMALNKYLGIPSLFHPLSKAAAQQLQNTLDKAKSPSEVNQAEEQAVQEQESNVQSPVENTPEATSAEDDAKSASNDFLKKGAIDSLAVFGAACFAQQISHDINTINRDRIALPAVAEALNFVAMGEQIKNGGDTSMTQVQAMGKSLTNNSGQAVWSAQALQALSGDTQHGGPDLNPTYKQAFLGSNIAQTLSDVSSPILATFPIPSEVGGPCGTLGIGIQIGVTVGASLASVASEVATAGLDTPATAAAYGWWAGEQTSQFVETGVAMHFVKSFVVDSSTSGKLAKDAFSGPLGGSLLAYGARYGAAIAGAAQGLVPLANTSSSAVSYQQEQQDQQQFKSEGLFARLFDINDYRSLAGHLADSVSPRMTTNLANGVGSFGSLGHSLLSNLSSIFLPKSLADQTPYNWGFPLYGLPDNLANTTDPSLANPYTNADRVAALLNSSNGQSYISKAKTCFGVDITQTQDDSGNNLWDVTPSQAIDMTSSDYQSANCGDTTDPNWQRMILFVLDTQTAKAAACWTGDDQSCQGIGYQTQSTGATPTTTPTSTAGLTNPFPGGWVPNRLDMGYDGTFKGQIVAPFDGTITYAGLFTGWCSPPGSSNCSQGVIIKADQDLGLATRNLYFTEGVTPIVHTGQHVTAGTPIANATASPYGDAYGTNSGGVGEIEWGLASDGSGFVNTEAVALGAGQCPASTPQSKSMVLAFSQWAQQQLGLPPPATTNDAGCA